MYYVLCLVKCIMDTVENTYNNKSETFNDLPGFTILTYNDVLRSSNIKRTLERLVLDQKCLLIVLKSSGGLNLMGLINLSG